FGLTNGRTGVGGAHLTAAGSALLLSLALFPVVAFAQEPSKDLIPPPSAGRTLTLRTIAFSPDGRYLAAGSGDTANGGTEEPGEVAIWDAKTLQLRWHHKLERGVPTLAISRDSKTLAFGSYSQHCYLVDIEANKLQGTLDGHGEAARAVAYSPDGQTLAVG